MAPLLGWIEHVHVLEESIPALGHMTCIEGSPVRSRAFAWGVLPLVLLLSSCSLVVPWGEAPPEAPPRLPGEFEPVEEVVVGWDPGFEAFYIDLVASLTRRVDVTIVADTRDDPDDIADLLEAAGVDLDGLDIVHLPTDSIWVRDFGPRVVQSERGRVAIDFAYSGRESDDALGRHLAARWKVPLVELPFEVEGGNLLSNGRGDCLSSETVIEGNPGVSEEHLRAVLATSLGCQRVLFLPALDGEPTGHVDMYASFTSPRDVMVGRYLPEDDPVNAGLLDRAAAELARAGFRVRRVPMPPNDDQIFRTYVNATAVNDAVLVPVYVETDAGEAEALAAFAAAYPGREIIPIASSELIELEGAVHCATLSIGE